MPYGLLEGAAQRRSLGGHFGTHCISSRISIELVCSFVRWFNSSQLQLLVSQNLYSSHLAVATLGDNLQSEPFHHCILVSLEQILKSSIVNLTIKNSANGICKIINRILIHHLHLLAEILSRNRLIKITKLLAKNMNSLSMQNFFSFTFFFSILAGSYCLSQLPNNYLRDNIDLETNARTRRETAADQNGDMIVHEREFVSSQARVQMECQREKIQIKVNFSQPFNGILGAGKLETSECKLLGNGAKAYTLQVPHNATQCDTHWDSSTSSIFNTLFIRFHSSLETGNDIAKNIMCRLTVGDLFVGRRSQKKKTQNTDQEASISSDR